MSQERIYVDGDRTFNKDSLKTAIDLLNNGKTIWIGIDCIGHGHNNACQEEYKRELEKHFGSKLQYKCTGSCSYIYTYWLGEVK